IGLLARIAAEPVGASLLVVPATVIYNWRSELERFAPDLKVTIAHPSAGASFPKEADGLQRGAIVITSHGYLERLTWAREISWELIVVDEAQAIKNPAARQTRAVKMLSGRTRLALTGTP